MPPALTSRGPRLKEALALRTSRRLLPGACHASHTLLGDKAPRRQGQGNLVPAGGSRARSPETPRPLPWTRSPGASGPARNKPELSFLHRDSRSWNLHPLGFAIFTHPEPSGLHGDASKQQIPGSNDVTFPFPASQAPGTAGRAGARARAPQLPGQARSECRPLGPAGPHGASVAASFSVPLRAAVPEPWSEGTGPGAASPPAPDRCHPGRPVGAAAGPGRRRRALLASGAAAGLAWEAPAASASELVTVAGA